MRSLFHQFQNQMMNIKLTRIVLTTIIGCLSFSQSINAATNRDTMTGGALGIIQCWHTKGKTKVIWQVIVSDPNKPINGTKFELKTANVKRDIFQGFPPTTNYQTVEYFSDIVGEVSITGKAYSFNTSGIHIYSLRKALNATCTSLT